MPKFVRMRYLGDGRAQVPVLGRDVDPGEVVSVPADLAARYAWPERLWRDVEATASTTRSKKTSEEGSDGDR